MERTAAAVQLLCGRTSHVRRRGRSTALRYAAENVGVQAASDKPRIWRRATDVSRHRSRRNTQLLDRRLLLVRGPRLPHRLHRLGTRHPASGTGTAVLPRVSAWPIQRVGAPCERRDREHGLGGDDARGSRKDGRLGHRGLRRPVALLVADGRAHAAVGRSLTPAHHRRPLLVLRLRPPRHARAVPGMRHTGLRLYRMTTRPPPDVPRVYARPAIWFQSESAAGTDRR